MRVVVFGAGVIGLTVAARLLEDGHEVDVRATARGPATTSAVAAALWYPYLAAPEHDTRRWGRRTYDVLVDLATTRPEAGVDIRSGFEYAPAADEAPPWHADVAAFTRHTDGWSFDAPVADMAHYLPWLGAQVTSRGGRIQVGATLELADLRSGRDVTHDAVVLATGLGARAVAHDASVVPVRGQVVLVEQRGIHEWFLDSADEQAPTYVVPRRDVVVCGGTALPDRWDTDVEEWTTRDIMRRCTQRVPALAEAPVVDVRVGLRPVRPAVRLGMVSELASQPPVIACYGHGGAGVTLSWGCADDVADLVSRLG